MISDDITSPVHQNKIMSIRKKNKLRKNVHLSLLDSKVKLEGFLKNIHFHMTIQTWICRDRQAFHFQGSIWYFSFLMWVHIKDAYTDFTLKSINIHCNISNFSVFTVPPDLIECKDCPVKVEVLEVTKQHKDIAAKLLEKFNREGNHTNYFKVNKVEKILKAVSGILS